MAVMKSIHKLTTMLYFLILLTGCEPKHFEITSLWALFKDEVAKTLLKAEQFEQALQVYLSLLETDPYEARVHSNVGVLLGHLQKPEEALKALQYALKIAESEKDLQAQFAIHYNLGVYFGSQKKVPEALAHYQAALDLNPTSIESKTNIELLTQQQSGQGKGDQSNQDQNKQDSKDNKEQKDQGDKSQDSKDKSDQKKDESNKKAENSPKYKPRPFKGDQLSENDVKKILGELGQQEKKIRANFDKKERKESRNEKDW